MRTKLFYIFFLMGLFAVSTAKAKNTVDTVSSLKGIEIKTSVDKAEIYIGDLINYKITITYDST
ncbi:MAG: hypothetical protein GXO93_07220, partial [FCB group bacterium]|nr:hypothetical protein [FCB group bacterium]